MSKCFSQLRLTVTLCLKELSIRSMSVGRIRSFPIKNGSHRETIAVIVTVTLTIHCRISIGIVFSHGHLRPLSFKCPEPQMQSRVVVNRHGNLVVPILHTIAGVNPDALDPFWSDYQLPPSMLPSEAYASEYSSWRVLFGIERGRESSLSHIVGDGSGCGMHDK